MDGMDMQCDPGVANLPVSDPRCVQAAACCTAFSAATNASQAAVSWAQQFEYGHWVTYYWVIILGLAAIIHGFQVAQDKRSQKHETRSNPTPNIINKVQAMGRWLSYRAFNHKYVAWIGLPQGGTLAFLCLTLVFLTALVFAERPYYREQFGYGSPPIAIRAGLMAFACVPILVALSGKANVITLLTGIGHERLNVLHRWVAWMSFGLSLVHTIPFFVGAVRDPGNGGFQRVKTEFRASYMGLELQCSGVPPLAMLFGLCIFSLPQIRRKLYESFYILHILLAITYLGLLFWHAQQEMDSWAYLWATLGIWGASWLARVLWFNRSTRVSNPWFQGCHATVFKSAPDTVRIEICEPPNFTYCPGQHCYLRFPHLSPLDNHPFTLASASNGIRQPSQKHGHLLFLAKVHDGFTRKLSDYSSTAATKQTSSVCIDGPYGGLSRPRVEQKYDSLLLIAGGSGISACLSWLTYVTSLMDAKPLKTVRLVWVIREAHSFASVSEELRAAMAGATAVKVQIDFYITGSTPDMQVAEKKSMKHVEADEECQIRSVEQPTHDSMDDVGTVALGRPILKTIVDTCLVAGKRLFVFACGPSGMKADISNVCAEAQRHVVQGSALEVALHVESFDW